MADIQQISVTAQTTSSNDVLYAITVSTSGGQRREVLRRYAEFVDLQNKLGDSFALPPPLHGSAGIAPDAQIDDQLIAGQKAGLAEYLNHLASSAVFRQHPAFLAFLALAAPETEQAPAEEAEQTPSLAPPAEEHPDAKASPIAAAYYPAWSADTHPPNKIDFSKFDILFFAFATPNSSSTINWEDNGEATLKNLVSSARKSGKRTKIVLSVGGWNGCHWFGHAVGNASNRAKFTNALVHAVNTFKLDGVDIDWEYPNESGAGNPHGPADAENLLALFRSLRKALGPSKIISSATTQMPWHGSSGKPLKDVSAFAAVMTYVNIMNYDVWEGTSKPGPNAPLDNRCGSSEQPNASAKAAFCQWTKAGMPASKLLLGLPLYGYVNKSRSTRLVHDVATDPGEDQFKYAVKSTSEMDAQSVQAAESDLSHMWGQQIPFEKLLRVGILKKKADGTYAAANGYTRGWDECSHTPFLYSVARNTLVTYDDPESLADKARYAKEVGMGGCFTWSLDQDDGVVLQQVIRSALGKK